MARWIRGVAAPAEIVGQLVERLAELGSQVETRKIWDSGTQYSAGTKQGGQLVLDTG
jgi:hypothetical protein